MGKGRKEVAERKAQTEAGLKEHQTSRADAKESMATATALRVKEPATYEKKKADNDANIATLGKAMAAIESGMACSSIQTPAAKSLVNYATEKADPRYSTWKG